MATQKQIEANRRNAQRSTGPVTELGKGVAKFNALKHGMTASTAVLPYEDPSSYAELRESFVATYRPANAVEASLVEVVANSYWRLLRARRAETATMTLGIQSLKTRHDVSIHPRQDDDMALAVVLSDSDDTLRQMERYHAKIERSYFSAIETLRKVQKERLREERLTTAQPRQIGFVSQTEAEFAPSVKVRAAGVSVTQASDPKITPNAFPGDNASPRLLDMREVANTEWQNPGRNIE